MILSLAPALLLLLALPALGGSVQVMLFGQPCQLQGPATITDAQLKAMHQISPEQTPLSESVQTLQASLEKLKLSPDTPAVLGRYVEQRAKAAKVRLSFEEALQAARKARSVQQFQSGIQSLVHPKRLKSMGRVFEKALKAGNAPSEWEQLRLDFAEISEPDGEEDFHRALRKLKVTYQCSFEAFDDEQHPPAAGTPDSASGAGKGLEQPASNH